jgi:acyl-CoA synthetase (AMP-forming)/AMP-acid ligase II
VDLGEKVVAVVLLQDRSEVGEDELIAFCKIRLASCKCPKKMYILDELPRNSMGKVLKGETRKMVS